jgi:acetyl esterase/lipase
MIAKIHRQLARSLQVLGILTSLVVATVSATADAAPDTPATAAHPVLEDRYPERHTAFAEGVVGIADLVYSVQPGFRPLRLDVYVPPGSPGSHPLVVFIHGGGWVSGHTRHSGAFQDWPGVLASLAAKGYVVRQRPVLKTANPTAFRV